MQIKYSLFTFYVIDMSTTEVIFVRMNKFQICNNRNEISVISRVTDSTNYIFLNHYN